MDANVDGHMVTDGVAGKSYCTKGLEEEKMWQDDARMSEEEETKDDCHDGYIFGNDGKVGGGHGEHDVTEDKDEEELDNGYIVENGVIQGARLILGEVENDGYEFEGRVEVRVDCGSHDELDRIDKDDEKLDDGYIIGFCGLKFEEQSDGHMSESGGIGVSETNNGHVDDEGLMVEAGNPKLPDQPSPLWHRLFCMSKPAQKWSKISPQVVGKAAKSGPNIV